MNRDLQRAARASPPRRAAPADADQLADRRRSLAARDHDRLRAGRDRGHRRASRSSEPDPYLAQVYRFGLLEDFDHLYRYSALLDRLEGKDANNILQSYTDILPGRPTVVEHRAPEDDLRRPYDRADRRAAHQAARAHASWRPSTRRTTTT